YNIKRKISDSLIVSFKNMINVSELINYSMSSFAVSWDEKNIILSCFKNLLVFTRIKPGFYTFSKSFLKPYRYESVKQITKSEYLLVQLYNYDDIPKTDRVVISKYNLNTNTIVKNIKPELAGLEYSHLTHKWYDNNSKYFLLADPLKYNITIYSNNLDSVFFLKRSIANWKNTNDSLFIKNYDNYNIKNSIENLHNADKNISRIEKIFFVNESKILISYKLAGETGKVRNVDIWTKKNKNQWILKDSNLITNITDLSDFNDTITVLNRPFPELNYTPDLHFYKNKVYLIWQSYFPECLGYTVRELSKKYDEYVKDHFTTFGVMVFNFKK
ncbi:MAG: hypothetical protein SGJ10_04490, partial [Bacteroidota bacterium]|nr:hypothetical protein [Bacteroidota bacterium]